MERTTRKKVYVIGLLLCLFVILNALWHTPLIYPVKVFTVILHELSHGLAAILTGGRIVRIEVSPELGGVCTTQGGWRFAVLPAGYLGSMALGCVIMLVAARSDQDRRLSIVIGSALLLLVALYIRTRFGIVFGLLSGVGMILLGRFASAKANEVVLLFLGVTSALYAVVDIKEDLISRTVPGSDAYQMSKLIPLPPVIWGILWILFAVVVVFFALEAALSLDTRVRVPSSISTLGGWAMRPLTWWIVTGIASGLCVKGYQMLLYPVIEALGGMGGGLPFIGLVASGLIYIAEAWAALIGAALVNGFAGGGFRVRLTSPGEGAQCSHCGAEV